MSAALKVVPFHAVRIERQYTAELVNRIVNHPSVLPHVAETADAVLDLSGAISDRRNFALFGEYGGVFFVALQSGLYEAHTQVLPEGRGEWGARMAWSALQWMFTKTDALEIVTRLPDGNVGAKALARVLKANPEFVVQNGRRVDGEWVPAEMVGWTVQHWMRVAPGMEEHGVALHDEFSDLGVLGEDHPEDAVHDRYAGATYLMMKGRQFAKAAVFYNRYAVMSGYSPIVVQSFEPFSFSVDGVSLVWDDTDARLRRCQ